jgi:cyclophilin family peptidyl-prolyl cis-trans isomerase
MSANRNDELARRRNIRLLVALALVGALVALALLMGGSEETGGKGGGGSNERPAAACGAEAPPEADPQTYEAPERVIAEGVDYRAMIETSCGSIEIDLLEADAPENVNAFVFLAQEGFFDGLTFHRVEQNSVIQSGDPNGQNGEPPDGPGFNVADELPSKANEYVYGVVGMANSGQPNTGGSQFFIVIHKNRPAGYQPFYSIFGEVTGGSFDGDEGDIGCNPSDEGIQTLEIIGCQPTRGGNDPVEAVKPVVPIYIESIEIAEA